MTKVSPEPQTTEVLIMADGTIYVHNLTVGMTSALLVVNPTDERFRLRLATAASVDPAPPTTPAIPAP